MATLNAAQTATVNITTPGAFLTVDCSSGAVVRVSWVSPGSVSGIRTVRNISEDLGPFTDNTVITLTCESGTATYTEIGSQIPPLVSGAGNRVVSLDSSMSAAQVTAAIQTALDGGGRRVTVIGSGYFPLSDRLYVDDDTTLVIEDGCGLVGPASLYYPGVMMGLIVNRQIMATRSNVTVTSSGTTATIAWTGHGKSVGSPIMLMGSTTRGYNGVYQVATVPDANTVTVTLEAVPEATTAAAVSWLGSVKASAANENITIIINGELNGNGANQPAPGVSPTDRYLGGVFLSGVLRPRVTGTGCIRDCKGYSILIAGASWPRVDSLELQSTYRDGAHFQGPIRHLRVEGLTGYTHDDFTSLTTGDLQSLELTEGEIEDVVIEKLDGQCSATGAIAAQFGKSAWWFADVEYRDLRSKVTQNLVHLKFIGTTASQYNLDQTRYVGPLTIDGLLWENATQTLATAAMVGFGSGCLFQDVAIRNVRMIGNAVANFGVAVWIGNSGTAWSGRHLLIEGLYSSTVGTAYPLIYGSSGTTWESITLRDCSPTVPDGLSFFDLNGMTVESLTLDSARGRLGNASKFLRLVSGTVNYVNVIDPQPAVLNYGGGNNWGEIVYSAGAAIRSVRFYACATNAYMLLQSTIAMNVTNGHHLAFIGCRRQNGKLFANLNHSGAGALRITTTGSEEIGASGNVFWLRGTGRYVLSESALNSETTAPLSFFDTATMDIFSPQRQVDVAGGRINRVEGGRCWNTNAAAGTLGTAGPVVCLGTAAGSWKREGNNALTY